MPELQDIEIPADNFIAFERKIRRLLTKRAKQRAKQNLTSAQRELHDNQDQAAIAWLRKVRDESLHNAKQATTVSEARRCMRLAKRCEIHANLTQEFLRRSQEYDGQLNAKAPAIP